MRTQGRKQRSFFSSIDTLESRRLLAAVSWDGGGGDRQWNNPLNWSSNVTPTSSDDVSISIDLASPITVSGAAAVAQSVTSNGRLNVQSSLLISQASSVFRLEVNGGTFGGAGAITITDESSSLGNFTFSNARFVGPGSVRFLRPVTFQGGAGTSRVLDGITFDAREVNVVGGALTFSDASGQAARLKSQLPKFGVGAQLVKLGALAPVLDGAVGIYTTMAAGDVLDLRPFTFVNRTGGLYVPNGTVKSNGGVAFSEMIVNSASSLVEIHGSMTWTAATTHTGGQGVIRFVGGVHSLNRQNAFSARLEVVNAVLTVNAPQSLSLSLINTSLTGTASLSIPIMNVDGGTLDYAGSISCNSLTFSGQPTTVKRQLFAENVTLNTGVVINLPAGTDPTNQAIRIGAAQQMTTRNNTAINGAAELEVFASLLVIEGTTHIQSPKLRFNEIGVQSAGNLIASGGVQRAEAGVLSGTWSIYGRVQLDTVPALEVNRGVIYLVGANASFPRLAEMDRNEGTLDFDGVPLFATDGSLTNAGDIIVSDSHLTIGGDLTNTATGGLGITVDDGLSVPPVTVTGSMQLGGELFVTAKSLATSASVSPVVLEGADRVAQFASVGARKRGLIQSGIAIYNKTQVIIDYTPADPTELLMTAASDTGFSSTDEITMDTTPTFTVKTNDVGIVRFFVDGVLREERSVASLGEFTHSFTVSDVLTDGDHTAKVVMVDQQGNASLGQMTLGFSIDTTAPYFESATLDLASQVRLRLLFSERILPGNANNVRFIDSATHSELLATALFNDQSNRTLRVDYAPTLPDANWSVTFVNTTFVRDYAGNSVLPWKWDFYILAGDINRDRTVGFDDLLTLARNYGSSGRTFYQGNISYDPSGLVNIDDLLLLAQRYGYSLLPPTSPIALTSNRGQRSRGSMSIIDAI